MFRSVAMLISTFDISETNCDRLGASLGALISASGSMVVHTSSYRGQVMLPFPPKSPCALRDFPSGQK
ncbi:hypothetical protein DQ04_08781040 [Trypanosoma grayi]|uniref:hypothetical protein n=1 Tax=Trypanosoma grayi TaxID=71804 RepID=UPI0004F474BE|nr:hypothetical protein DQ04_08781040 [Trypanosoma grayi]KEG07806.1 hypothetical protein DQ04_08781040 [Trypanosoma grayi]